ncbi:MAG: hypothetical protein R2695_11465 [Acidimicrobiales bacterium]
MDRANVAHQWRLDLFDEDGHPLEVRGNPLVVHGRFEAGRPAGLRPGTPLSVPLAINFPVIPTTPGRSYTWQLSIDEATHVDGARASTFAPAHRRRRRPRACRRPPRHRIPTTPAASPASAESASPRGRGRLEW